MLRFMNRLLLALCAALVCASPVLASSLPEGAGIKIGRFTFPQAAYSGAGEESERLEAAFRGQLVAALQQAGLKVTGMATDEPGDSDREEAALQDETEVVADEAAAEEAAADVDGEKYRDDLTALVAEVEKSEKKLAAKKGVLAGKPKKAGAYVISGVITQYEEQAGAPVSTGKNRRLRAEVVVQCTFRVRDAAGKNVIVADTSASATRVVPETMDIHTVLQGLGKKAFFEAAHNIAERVSGQKRVTDSGDAEPGSSDDDYADTPGKRLKSKSGRMKFTI